MCQVRPYVLSSAKQKYSWNTGMSHSGNSRLAVDYISRHCTTGVDPIFSVPDILVYGEKVLVQDIRADISINDP